jgi:hypothetical protein
MLAMRDDTRLRRPSPPHARNGSAGRWSGGNWMLTRAPWPHRAVYTVDAPQHRGATEHGARHPGAQRLAQRRPTHRGILPAQQFACNKHCKNTYRTHRRIEPSWVRARCRRCGCRVARNDGSHACRRPGGLLTRSPATPKERYLSLLECVPPALLARLDQRALPGVPKAEQKIVYFPTLMTRDTAREEYSKRGGCAASPRSRAKLARRRARGGAPRRRSSRRGSTPAAPVGRRCPGACVGTGLRWGSEVRAREEGLEESYPRRCTSEISRVGRCGVPEGAAPTTLLVLEGLPLEPAFLSSSLHAAWWRQPLRTTAPTTPH